jgi:hypothetical protein
LWTPSLLRPHNGRTELRHARKQVGSNVSESYQNSGALINTAALAAAAPITVKFDAILLDDIRREALLMDIRDSAARANPPGRITVLGT